jgi:hypothetical protein
VMETKSLGRSDMMIRVSSSCVVRTGLWGSAINHSISKPRWKMARRNCTDDLSFYFISTRAMII